MTDLDQMGFSAPRTPERCLTKIGYGNNLRIIDNDEYSFKFNRASQTYDDVGRASDSTIKKGRDT